MNKNSIIEMGSTVDVIISFREDTTINGSNFSAFEPYLFLKDVKALLRYRETKKKKSAQNNIFNINFANIDSLILGDITFSKKLASLYVEYYGEATQKKRKFITLTAFDGDPDAAIYMNESFNSNGDYYIYDSSFNKILNATYIESSNSFTSPSFTVGEEYLVSFTSDLVGERFNLKQRQFPYFNIQIQGKGNVDKETKSVLVNIDKASLNSILDFNFVPGDKINAPLEFVLFDSEENYIIFED